MSEFDDFIKGLGSDIKAAAEQVSKKTGEAFEISKRKAERIKLKGKIQSAYQRLGELTYSAGKTEEDISEESAAITAELDSYFERIQEIYEEITMIKSGCYVSDDGKEEEDIDWEEEYAEEEDLELLEADAEDPEVEVELIVKEEVPVTVEVEDKEAFDINID